MPDDVPLAVEPGRLAVPAEPAPGPVAAALPAAAAPPVAAVTNTNAWDTGMQRWDFLYGVIYLAVLVAVVVSVGSAVRTAIALGAVAVMAPWYFFVGRPHMRSVDGTVTSRSVIYATGLVVLFAIAVLQAPNVWFLSVALLPQLYNTLPSRWAIIPAVLVTASGAASVAYWNHTAHELETAIALFVAIIAFTTVFGGYIGGIITQSDERASLIAQLEATRADLPKWAGKRA